MSSSECMTGIGMPEVVVAGGSSGFAVVVVVVVVVVDVVVDVVVVCKGGRLMIRMTLDASGFEITEGVDSVKEILEAVTVTTVFVGSVDVGVANEVVEVARAFFRRMLSRRKFSRRMRHDERCELI